MARVLQIRITAKYVIDVSEYLLPSGEGVLEQGHLCQSQKTTRNAKLSTHIHHRKELQKLVLIINCLTDLVALKIDQKRFHKSYKIQHQRIKSHQNKQQTTQ